MRSNYNQLGRYIQIVNNRNNDLKVERLLGVSIQKILMPSIANIVGTDMSTYKIIKKNQFAYGPVTSRNGDKISVALLEDHKEAMVSQAYVVFEVIDETELLPEYLMMWFRRPEFDRYARFKSHGSAREIFDWAEMYETELPIPSIQKQREIVAEYNTVVNRIKLNEQLNQKLEETAQALYKHWFVDFEFPDENGKPYKSSGGNMVWNEELDKEIPEGWRNGVLSDIINYSKNRIQVSELTLETYISTDNMLTDRGGVTIANSLPSALIVPKFHPGDILISNIRPYFKKIWIANYVGGCSNDVLCFQSAVGIEPLFTYSILETDDFFEYVMQGAKGTKMPRGDKDWIMNYVIVLPDSGIMDKFKVLAHSLSIEEHLRKEENKVLISMSQVLLSQMTKVELEKEIA